jgi:hypothetical protein
MVFADKGATLSPTALATIRGVAQEAKSARQVTLIGRAEDAARVKDALVKQGVPAQAIVVQREARAAAQGGRRSERSGRSTRRDQDLTLH